MSKAETELPVVSISAQLSLAPSLDEQACARALALLPGQPEPQTTSDSVQVQPDFEAGKIHSVAGAVVVNGEKITYRGYFPENRSVPGLAIVAPGWGGFLKSSEPVGKALSEEGQAAVIFEPARRGRSSIREELVNPQGLHAKTIEAIHTDLPNNRKIAKKMPEGGRAVAEQRVILAQSMGGMAATRFVESHHEEVESLYLLMTVVQGRTIPAQILRAIRSGNLVGSAFKEIIPFVTSEGGRSALDHIGSSARYFGSRVTRTVGEGFSCLTADLRPSLQRLGTLGIRRVAVNSGRDIFINTKSVDGHVDEKHELPAYGHFAVQRKAELVARTVVGSRVKHLERAKS